MKTITLAAAALLSSGAALAQDECIENAAGQIVCGDDAAAVRARIKAEERLVTPGIDAPAAKPASYINEPEAAVEDTTSSYNASPAVGPTYVSAAAEETVPAAPRASRGSVYDSYGQSVFLRGGYVFAARGASDYEAPSFAAGYRTTFREAGRSTFSLEGELIYSRDSEDLLVLGLPVEATIWGLSAIGAVRWQYALGEHVSPFASVGIGPGYFHASLDDGVTSIEDGDLTFAYTGRTGVAFAVSDQISLETAYRYLGTAQSGTPGYHTAEIGLNYDF